MVKWKDIHNLKSISLVFTLPDSKSTGAKHQQAILIQNYTEIKMLNFTIKFARKAYFNCLCIGWPFNHFDVRDISSFHISQCWAVDSFLKKSSNENQARTTSVKWAILNMDLQQKKAGSSQIIDGSIVTGIDAPTLLARRCPWINASSEHKLTSAFWLTDSSSRRLSCTRPEIHITHYCTAILIGHNYKGALPADLGVDLSRLERSKSDQVTFVYRQVGFVWHRLFLVKSTLRHVPVAHLYCLFFTLTVKIIHQNSDYPHFHLILTTKFAQSPINRCIQRHTSPLLKKSFDTAGKQWCDISRIQSESTPLVELDTQ